MTKLSCAKIKSEVLKMDPGLTPDDPCFRAQVVLLSSLQVGPNIRKLATFTGFPIDEITKFSRNLRRNNIWRGAKVYANWFEEHGGIDLALDTNVALGFMERSAGLTVTNGHHNTPEGERR